MEPVNHCPHCGAAVDVNASVCPECRQELVKRKYCPHCGERIDADCIICPKCGKQAGELPQDKQINIVNNNNSSASAAASASVGVRTAVLGKYCNKWTAFFLCLFLGYFGAHKFYEGRIGMGILYLLTIGLFGIGWIVDIILILMKPNPYFVAR